MLNAHILPSVGFNYTLDINIYSEQTKARESTQKAHLLWTSCTLYYTNCPTKGLIFCNIIIPNTDFYFLSYALANFLTCLIGSEHKR